MVAMEMDGQSAGQDIAIGSFQPMLAPRAANSDHIILTGFLPSPSAG